MQNYSTCRPKDIYLYIIYYICSSGTIVSVVLQCFKISMYSTGLATLE